MIARQQQALFGCVPDSEGKHSQEVIYALVAILFIGVDNDFTITIRREVMSTPFQFLSNLAEVVALTVEDKAQIAAFVGDGRLPARHIDDTQAAHSERRLSVDVVPFFIGTAMSHAATHPL